MRPARTSVGTQSLRKPAKAERGADVCLQCKVLEGKLEMAEAVIKRLMQFGPTPNAPTAAAQTPPKPEKPLPKVVQRALVLQFPGRTRERAENEGFARELVASGMPEAQVADMIQNGRPIDL